MAISLTASYSCLAPNSAHAQVIVLDQEPAQTIDTMSAVVLDEPIATTSRPRIIFQVGSDVDYSSNVLGLSNLPGGLELEAQDGWLWSKRASAVALFPVSDNVLLYGFAGLSHTNYLSNSHLDFFDISGGLGAILAVSSKTRLGASFVCSSERNADFEQYYSLCSPAVDLTTAVGDPYTGTGLEFGVRGLLGLGEEEMFGSYEEASVHVDFQAGRRMRFQIRPEARVRVFDVPNALQFYSEERTDYQASVRAALFFRNHTLTFGVAAVPRVNWSDFEQYRYWEVRGGPFIRARF